MPIKENCNYFFGGDAMEEHWDRLKWNFTHLRDRKTPNPYKFAENGKERTALKDLHHSLMNIPTEYCRNCPFAAGHVWFVHIILTIILGIALIVAITT